MFRESCLHERLKGHELKLEGEAPAEAYCPGNEGESSLGNKTRSLGNAERTNEVGAHVFIATRSCLALYFSPKKLSSSGEIVEKAPESPTFGNFPGRSD